MFDISADSAWENINQKNLHSYIRFKWLVMYPAEV